MSIVLKYIFKRYDYISRQWGEINRWIMLVYLYYYVILKILILLNNSFHYSIYTINNIQNNKIILTNLI